MPTLKDSVNALRFLSIDAVQKANSGHPGMPMGMADIAEVLWNHFLKHNPTNPRWFNRDRFVLSNGHGSMLLYSLLHLTGYNICIEDIKNFRQLNSKTPGHPEYNLDIGIETTTGPLGQGLANAVGMALAEKILGEQFNRGALNIVDHNTYVFVGDGCLMEGISHEACSLAGIHKLGKLIVFWDNNKISIDGDVKDWFCEDVAKRFESYGWHVVKNVDGHDSESIKNAILEAKYNDKPSLICCKTKIACGAATLEGSNKSHGAPLGKEEILATRKKLNWKYEPFVIPHDIYKAWDFKKKGQELQDIWDNIFEKYEKEYPSLAKEFLRRISGKMPSCWNLVSKNCIEKLNEVAEDEPTRKSSKRCLEYFGSILPELIGGSADLSESNCTLWEGSKKITTKDASGNYIHYGVREFAMFAIMTGLRLHGGFLPYGGTFLVFADYGNNALRMAALIKQKVIFIFTHDSIGLGEDGPTHQPVEHISTLRLIPNLSIWRPCDAPETAVAWKYAIENDSPTCLILTRQKVSQQMRTSFMLESISKGGYVIFDTKNTPDAIIIATGSEVSLAISVAKKMAQKEKNIRVVSMVSIDTFEKQSDEYKESVLPKNVTTRLAIEAGKSDLWYKYVGLNGKVMGLDTFGKSAPDKKLFEVFGFTEHNVEVSLNCTKTI